MIEIKNVKNSDELKKLYKESGFLFNDNSAAVVAYESGEKTGTCLFYKNKGYLTVLDINPKNDIAFADGLLRSALFVGTESGIVEAYYTDESPVELIKKLGFIQNEEKRQINVAKLFSGCECCKK